MDFEKKKQVSESYSMAIAIIHLCVIGFIEIGIHFLVIHFFFFDHLFFLVENLVSRLLTLC